MVDISDAYHLPVILPELQYLLNSDELSHTLLAQQSLISTKKLPFPLKFEQTMLAIKYFYNEQGIKQGFVHLNRTRDQDTRYGLRQTPLKRVTAH